MSDRSERHETAGSKLTRQVLAVTLACSLGAATSHAATLPAGFTEALVASGLASPTAMAFAPDGRLFVCQQGGALRVIKNGALLPTPFVTRHRQLRRRARPARRRLRSRTSPPTSSSTSTTPPRRRPIHNRVSRFTANGDVAVPGSEVDPARPRQPVERHQPQRRRDPLRARRQALRRRRRERRPAPTRRRSTTCSARCCASTPTARSRPTTRSSTRPPATTARSGRSACATRSRSRSSPAPAACSSTTSARAPGRRSTTASPARTTAGRRPRAPTTDPGASRSPLYAYDHEPAARAPSPAARSTTRRRAASRPSYAGDYFFADYCGGWIRTARSAARNAVAELRHRHLVARSTCKVGRRRQPLLPGARRRRRRLPHRATAPQAPTHHARTRPARPCRVGQPATFTRRRIGHGAAHATSGSATASTSPARPRASYTLASAAARPTTARASAPSSPNAFGNAASNAATLTVTRQPARRRRRSPQPAAGTLYTRRQTHHLRRHRHRPGGRHAAGERLHLAGRLPPRHAHPSVHAGRPAARPAASFTIPTTGETSANVWYRIYLTVTRLGGPDPHDAPRHRAAHVRS